MKRLVEDESLHDGVDTSLAELLRAAGSFRPDPFRKRRILVRLARLAAPMGARFWARPGIAAVLLASGSAAAALGHRYGAHRFGIVDLRKAETASVASVGRTTTAQHSEATTVAAPTEVADEPALSTSEPPVNAAHEKRTIAQARPDCGEDATYVLEAIQALRTERDPVRAQALLDDYLKAHARGVLSGEALALSIEAAAARSDPRAADYARRYLAAYPTGKYRALAMRALDMQR